ncbi:MAG: 16S rRNA (adenine(1518)-N(6)/adenine(1519)-N(6))-dimethyltransferase RsmA [Firmicutes bacterium]|nr:16S rRNA (adenine(1518)-N(6)/adenine(1519)-N(6))-dimethyltransferase RsmA [Bacillota bacterium]
MDKLYSPRVTKDVLNKHGFRLSKSLGQNFLIDGNIIDKICEGAEIENDDLCLEIGPGIGTLTQGLLERAKKVLAIEIDKKLIPVLNDTLGDYNNLEIINGDVLKLDLKNVINEKLGDKKIKVAANLPYYITTPIVMKLLEEKLNIKKIVVMVQKEVAMRMQAEPGTKDYGALSIAVQYYSNPEIVTIVPNNVFIPKPKVDSAVIALNVYDEPKVKVKDEKLMFEVVKAAFGKRRKTLANSLSSSSLNIEKSKIKEILNSVDIDPRLRGEKLSIEQYAKIADKIVELNL